MKPLLCSPALGALIEAFNANKLVCSDIALATSLAADTILPVDDDKSATESINKEDESLTVEIFLSFSSLYSSFLSLYIGSFLAIYKDKNNEVTIVINLTQNPH